jgi:Glycosyl transferase family 2
MSVSVIIPTYNRAHRLAAAIDSVLRQRHDDIEILVIDDGSVDNTREVVARYQGAATYIYQEHGGSGAARNTGMRHATKEFLAFLDSDDHWCDFKLSAQLAMLKARPEVGLVFSDFVIEKPCGVAVPNGASIWAGRELSFPAMERIQLSRPTEVGADSWPASTLECWVGPMYRQLIDELPILTSSVIVRRSALGDRTWYSEGLVVFEDWEFFAQVARRAAVGYIAAPTVVNVGHADLRRLSKCSALVRAQSYQTLLEHVWLSDQSFADSHGGALRSAYGRALLAVAREALLADRRDLARAAMDTWRSSTFGERRTWATIYGFCIRLPHGGAVLKNVLRGRTLVRVVTGSGQPHGSVNPAA